MSEFEMIPVDKPDMDLLIIMLDDQIKRTGEMLEDLEKRGDYFMHVFLDGGDVDEHRAMLIEVIRRLKKLVSLFKMHVF